MKTAYYKRKQRQAIVEDALINGLTEKELRGLEHEGKKLFSAKALTKDVKEIQTKWLHHDTKWFNRVHISRVETSRRYRKQLARLNKLLAEESEEIPVVVILGAEKLITYITEKLHETESEIDPDQYLRDLGAVYNEQQKEQGAHIPDSQLV